MSKNRISLGFDASGDANEFSGAKTRDIRFIDVVARDAPRADGNAFEIEDGVENVLVENATVENVAGNGFGALRWPLRFVWRVHRPVLRNRDR